MEQEIIEKYLYAVHQVQEAERMRISKDNFKAVIEATGLTERELRIVHEECQRLSMQGETYFKSKNYPKAAELLARALDIDPYNLKTLLLAVHANLYAYIDDNKAIYHERISAYTERGLIIDPAQTYFAQVDTEISRLAPTTKAAKKAFVWAIASSFFFVLGLGFFLYQLFQIDFFFGFSISMIFVISLIVLVATAGIFILAWVYWLVQWAQAKQQRTRLLTLDYQQPNTQSPWMDKIFDALRGFFK
jgi:tetratricopeptide (TPR) repeat protein